MTVEEPSKTEEVDVNRVLWMTGSNLPSFLEVDGVNLVITSAEEYKELVAARTKLLRLAMTDGVATSRPQVRLGLSTIERDPEVADFLRARFRGGVTIAALRVLCVAEFGEERTPSRQRIQQFRGKFLG